MQQEVQYTKEKRTRAKKRELIVLQSMLKTRVDLGLGRLFCIQKQNQWKWNWRKRRMALALATEPIQGKEKTCKRLYGFLQKAAEAEKWDYVEWGFETLKMLYGKRWAVDKDAARLGALVRAVSEAGKDDCAIQLMSGFVPLYRNHDSYHENIISAIEVVALYAYRNRKTVLLAKCGDYLCRIALDDESAIAVSLQAVQRIGTLAILRKEVGLFREMMTRTVMITCVRAVPMEKRRTVFLAWLEKILYYEEQSCYNAWRDVFADSIRQGHWTSTAMLDFVESCRPLAGLSAMNSYAPMMRYFLADMLYYAELAEDDATAIASVQIVGMAMRIAVQDYPPEVAMGYVAPLVNFGGNQAWRQVAYPSLYRTGEGRVLAAIWQVFLLLERELLDSSWGQDADKLTPIYEQYHSTFPITDRDNLWWRSLFAYRMKIEGTPIPHNVKKLTKKERTALIRR